MAKQTYQPILATKETAEKLTYLARQANKPKTTFLKELLDNLFQVGCEYEHGLEMTYSISMLGKSVLVEFSGRSNLIVGSMSEADLEKLKKERFEEVKKDIAEKKVNKK